MPQCVTAQPTFFVPFQTTCVLRKGKQEGVSANSPTGATGTCQHAALQRRKQVQGIALAPAYSTETFALQMVHSGFQVRQQASKVSAAAH